MAARREAVHQDLVHGITHVNAAIEDLAQGDEELLACRLFHDVAIGTGAQDSFGVDRLVVHRQHEDRQARMLSTCISDQIDPIALLERNVDDDDVRVQFADRGARFLHRLDFATDHEIVFLVDQASQSLAHDRMIVDDQHASSFLFCGDPDRVFHRRLGSSHHLLLLPESATNNTGVCRRRLPASADHL